MTRSNTAAMTLGDDMSIFETIAVIGCSIIGLWAGIELVSRLAQFFLGGRDKR